MGLSPLKVLKVTQFHQFVWKSLNGFQHCRIAIKGRVMREASVCWIFYIGTHFMKMGDCDWVSSCHIKMSTFHDRFEMTTHPSRRGAKCRSSQTWLILPIRCPKAIIGGKVEIFLEQPGGFQAWERRKTHHRFKRWRVQHGQVTCGGDFHHRMLLRKQQMKLTMYGWNAILAQYIVNLAQFVLTLYHRRETQFVLPE